MKRILILASHHTMAEGLKDTLDFISGGAAEVRALAAYMDNAPVDAAVDAVMAELDDADEAVVLTDLNSGSVNQQFFRYLARPHTHVVSGMNLPLALVFALEPADDYLSAERVREIVEDAKSEIKYANDLAAQMGDDDDDE